MMVASVLDLVLLDLKRSCQRPVRRIRGQSEEHRAILVSVRGSTHLKQIYDLAGRVILRVRLPGVVEA